MQLLSKKTVAAAAAAGLGLAALTGGVGASASTPDLHVQKTLSRAFVAPLQFAVQGKWVYVADSATSTLSVIGRSNPIARGPAPSANPVSSGDLAGVAVNGDDIAYTTTSADHKDTRLTVLDPGHRPVVAHISTFEKNYNPDHHNTYGLRHPGSVNQKCKAELTASHIPVSYRGGLDSHAYSVAALKGEEWAVADAGANDIVKVDRRGHVSLIAVLPTQWVHVTKAVAAVVKAPDCVGATYGFEAVPTDVEVGPHGKLYVTTLPGGMGGQGSVYRVWRGGAHRIATGFAAATNLAIGPHGRIYVAELGSGTISTVWHGRPHRVASLPGVVAVEWANGHLYASTAPAVTGGKGPGTVVVLDD